MNDHEFIYGQDFLTDGVSAGCTCGWEVDADDQADAIDKWENHCDVVFMEATERTAEGPDHE